MGKLALIQLLVEALLCKKLLMGPLLDDLPVPHDQNHIRILDGGKPVGPR